ncbi:lyso-ornithine lipid acyltransferase [Shimia gijangensis]|uniref:Lyso-ornithine lipid acyltransferase n=1 Tax=Shimia gijangensis TaxID=1470563 RepID=A0A1M6S7L1_9RHOB|nr:lysophospholipid acyltransferase family protein [Shimia gijangensis]SHK40507.1 lyso-ornithine lipid acyltransferase [Shimia gijangensis]
MTSSWDKHENYPEKHRISALGWLRVLGRGVILGSIVFGCLGILLLVRVIEKPIHGLHRPWTPFITQFVCRSAFWVLGMKFSARGDLMTQRGAVVANHSSWLDIFALNARKRIYFVSKAEVAKWPGIGWLAKATGTVFIKRDPKEARRQKEVFEARLLAGHKLLFFPEGTSTDAVRVLPFKPTLFAAFFAPELRDALYVQPVTVMYHAPAGEDARFYGWWGDMEFGEHLLQTLSQSPQGRVELIYHTPVAVRDFASRKALAAYCEGVVRGGHLLTPDGNQSGPGPIDP